MAGQKDSFLDFYKLLGVATGATAAHIRRAYMSKAKSLHPDIDGGDTIKMQQINRAYMTLRDASKRRVYDLMHQTNTGTSTLFYRTEDEGAEDLSSGMTDEEIDDYINTVYREIQSIKPVENTPLGKIKERLRRKK